MGHERQRNRQLGRVMTIMAGAVALFVALAPALAIAYSGWAGKVSRLQTLAGVGAAEASGYLVRNRDAWRYAPQRIQAFVEKLFQGEDPVAVDILDPAGAPLELSARESLPFPVISALGEISDFGVPVGYVRLTESWRREALFALAVSIVGGVLAYMIFFPLRRLPLAAIDRAMGELVASEAALNKAQAIAHIGSWRFSIADNVLRWSDETRRIFGLPVTEPPRFDALAERVHPDDRAHTVTAWGAARRGVACDIEYRIVRNDDAVRWARERVEASFDSSGSPVSVDGTIEDVTERRDHEERLRIAKEQAEAGNRAKTRLLANMSHELRTPLNAVIGLSEAMTMQALGPLGHPAYHEYSRRILTSGERLLDIVSDLLYAADLETGDLAVREEHIDIEAEIAWTMRVFADRAEAAGVKVRFAPLASGVRLFGDRAHFRRILSSLLSNAIAFSPRGETVELRLARGDDGRIDISVVDCGDGMTAAEIEMALKPFGRLETGNAYRHEGVGLGLSIAVGLARAHGGNLTVQSAKGQGSVFTVAFPPERAA